MTQPPQKPPEPPKKNGAPSSDSTLLPKPSKPPPPVLPVAPTRRGETSRYSDIWNAEQIVQKHSASLRWVSTWGKGLYWDNRRWVLDSSSRWPQLAQETARELFAEGLVELRRAKDSGDATATAQAGKLVAHAAKSQSYKAIQAMLAIAKTQSQISVAHDQLDADPWLLNCTNGTIELKTGGIHSHRRSDLLTKIAPVQFDPQAKCPTWDRFLARCLGEDKELMHYIQKLVGYSLTGVVSEHVLIFNYGAGRNGKSTFTSTLHAMLSDYAAVAPRKLLFKSRNERHETELTVLHGKRFVTCSEVEEGQAFDEALVKDLTGGDSITARRMREDHWEFIPTHKFWLNGNHKPIVHGSDEGIWRRLRLAPWETIIPAAEIDKALGDKLRAELPGILAWAVRGCQLWQREGLEPPLSVVSATRTFRDENDVLGEFFRLHTVFCSDGVVSRRALRVAYEEFCKDNGIEALGARRFAGRLRERGVTETSVRTKTPPFSPCDAWRGVRLMTTAEALAAPNRISTAQIR